MAAPNPIEIEEMISKITQTKENKDMINTTNLRNDFVTALKEKTTNFNNWVETSTVLFNASNSFNKATNDIKEVNEILINAEKSEIMSVNTIEIDLAKEGIDVSKWEDPVKPVKAIMSIMAKDNGNKISIEIGNMVMLMEDGTFKTN